MSSPDDEGDRCIPLIDGVLHLPHTYTPEDREYELECPGVRIPNSPPNPPEETRFENHYRMAMWVNYGGVKKLHKGGQSTKSWTEIQEWKKEYEEDFRPGLWFIIWETVEVRSYIVN